MKLFVSFKYELYDSAELRLRKYIDGAWEFRILRKVYVLEVSNLYDDLIAYYLIDSCMIFKIISCEAWFIQSYLFYLGNMTHVAESVSYTHLGP